MSVILWILAVLVVIVWAFTIVDVFRRGHSGWAKVGWIALIIVLPFIGSIIYWAVRKPTADEVEQARLAEADYRHSAASRGVDSTRTGL